MYIAVVSEASRELHEALQRLVPQLGAHKTPPTMEDVVALVRSEASTLLIAREPDESGSIVGIVCLVVYRVPTGVRSIIEDVVVETDRRGRGIGAALLHAALEMARAAGAEGVSLTSNPKREAANQLYQSMGFELRQTNPYYCRLK
jgi:ribosomal protein S18 acetylase RimI-like enzyme